MADEVKVASPPPAKEVAPPEAELSLDDHLTYSQQLYDKPSWVLQGAFTHSKLDRNKTHTVASVKKALEDMLGQKDKRYEGKQ